MTTNSDDSNRRGFGDEVALSGMFRLLSNHRRRVAVQYLATQNGATTVSDVVDQITLVEGDDTDENKEQILISLVHNHLPVLAEAAIIKYDPGRETVELDAQATDTHTYLDFAATD